MEPLNENLLKQLATSGSAEWLEQKLEMLVPAEVEDLPVDREYPYYTLHDVS
jgi:hypothetical protein